MKARVSSVPIMQINYVHVALPEMRVRSKCDIFSIIPFAYFVFPLRTLISLYFFSSFCLAYLRKCRCLFLSVRFRPLVTVSLLNENQVNVSLHTNIGIRTKCKIFQNR